MQDSDNNLERSPRHSDKNGSVMQTSQLEGRSLEYTTLLENMRHYHDHRFKQLTLWAAVSAVLINTLFSEESLSCSLELSVKFLGIVVSVAFLVMDIRIVDHWRHFMKRIVRLEEAMGFDLFTQRPKRHIFGSTNATRLLYVAVLIFWVTMLFV